MGDDATDIGVPLAEPTADPGALEIDGVLTVEMEAEVEAEAEAEAASIGDSAHAPKSWSSALVMGEVLGNLMEGTSISASSNCGGV